MPRSAALHEYSVAAARHSMRYVSNAVSAGMSRAASRHKRARLIKSPAVVLLSIPVAASINFANGSRGRRLTSSSSG